MLKKAFFNTTTSLILKIFGFIYSIAMIGFISRHVSEHQMGLLLLSFNYIMPLGLVQAGMSSLVLRAVMHNHIRTGSISGTTEIGVCFRMTVVISIIAALIIVPFAPTVGLEFLIPTFLIMLVGYICSSADGAWFGTERTWVVNLCLAISFLLLTVTLAIAQFMNIGSLTLYAFITYSATPIASIISFILHLRDPVYRGLLLRSSGNTLSVLRAALPMFLASLATSVLLALPTASTFWAAMPHLQTEETPLLRLSTIANNSMVVMLAPFMPFLLKTLHRSNPRQKLRFLNGLTIAVVATIILIVPVLYYVLPVFTKLWIGLDVTQSGVLLPWALVMACWIGVAISGQIALMICDPLKVAAVVGICDLVILAMMLMGALGAPVTVAMAMLCGLAVHVMLALALIYKVK